MATLFDMAATVIEWIKIPSVQDNLIVLFTGSVMGIYSAVLSSTTWGTPRLHSTVKLWSEILTRIHLAFLTYYAYLIVTYEQRKAIWALVVTALLCVQLSGYFTKKIVTKIETYHKCKFVVTQCPFNEHINCSHKEDIIADPLHCTVPMTRLVGVKILIANFIIGGIGALIALSSSFIFTKEPPPSPPPVPAAVTQSH